MTEFKTEIIFFDLDGTLYRNNQISDDTLQLLSEIHDKGIKVAIATGRGIGMMPKEMSELIEQGVISAYVFMNGQYSRTKSEVISHYPLSFRECETIIKVCEKHQLDYKFDSDTYCAWAKASPVFEQRQAEFANCIVDNQHHKQHKIYQGSFLFDDNNDTATDLAQVQIDLNSADLMLNIRTGRGADIIPKWLSKLVGVKDVCNYFRINMEESMAFGDGLNDLKMLEETAIGIAMGDSEEPVKGSADYVTGTLEEDGIRTALAHYGIL